MCGERVETNELVLCHCTADQYKKAKNMVADMMTGGVRDNGGGYESQKVMKKLYSTGTEGAAIDRHSEYTEEDEQVTKTNALAEWVKAFQANGKIGRNVAHTWAYEHLLRIGGNIPLWTGVITKPMVFFLLKWDGIEPNEMTRTIKLIRHMLMTHAKVVWSKRCETVYSLENEKKRMQRTGRKVAMEVLKGCEAVG